jgi:hypothetical protein
MYIQAPLFFILQRVRRTKKSAFDIKCVRLFSVTLHQNIFYCNKYVMSCPWDACRNACGSSLQNCQYSQLAMKMETAGYLKTDRFVLGSSPYGPDAPRPYGPLCPIIWYQLRRALSLYQSSRWPPDLKILMSSGSKKGTQIHYPFHSKSPSKRIPSRFPTFAPMERYLLRGHFYVSLLICIFLSFPQSSQ